VSKYFFPRASGVGGDGYFRLASHFHRELPPPAKSAPDKRMSLIRERHVRSGYRSRPFIGSSALPLNLIALRARTGRRSKDIHGKRRGERPGRIRSPGLAPRRELLPSSRQSAR